MGNGTNGKTRHHLFSTPHTLEEKVAFLYEHQRITDLLNEYAYTLDQVMVDQSLAESHWAKLFTEDCEVTYPFGTRHGREGLAEWCCSAELRFHRMMHLSSNFTIKFDAEDADVAYGRSSLLAVCGTDARDIAKVFQEGGYYYWSFRRVKDDADSGNGVWKISQLFLDINWTVGDSLGLNDN